MSIAEDENCKSISNSVFNVESVLEKVENR